MKVYVVTHEPISIDLPPDYELFQVGAAVNGAFCEHNDAVGEDNISVKNPNYCELTAAYWIWKNDHENDIVGLMHYRRFLTRSILSNSIKHLIDENTVIRNLRKYDFLAPKRMEMIPNVKKQMLDGAVRHESFDILEQVVCDLYPDYKSAFTRVFYGSKTYICNIFIARKKDCDEYYSWLFSIFDEMEKYVDMSGYSTQEQRLYGYLSERLFTVYAIKNNKRVKEFRMLTLPGHSFAKRIINGLKNKLKNKLKQILYALLNTKT